MAAVISVSEAEIDLWSFSIDPNITITTSFQGLLSQDERCRAARFILEHQRRFFVICHGILRHLLGCYLGADPASIEFQYGRQGKPILSGPMSLSFNLSHTTDMMVCGVTKNCSVGIDVEVVRPLDDLREIAERFFCKEENAELLSYSEAEQTSSFYRCWTRKEAFLKATGEGLSTPPRSFCVTLGPSDDARFLHIGGDRVLARSWNLVDVELGKPYVTAVAYPGGRRSVRVRPTMTPSEFLRSICRA
jgi:4'-phosphopantetheinyl transferase